MRSKRQYVLGRAWHGLGLNYTLKMFERRKEIQEKEGVI